MSRPFEVGDMVVLTDRELGFVIETNNWGHFPIAIKSEENGVYSVNKMGYFGDCGRMIRIVKHIRKPRKGSAEARAIVAMLAKEHRKSLHYAINAFGEGSIKQLLGADKKVNSAYRKAKEMLK